MRTYFTLVRRELGGHFLTWSGYFVLAAVVFLLGLSFVGLVTALRSVRTETPFTEVFYDTYYFWLIVLIATPVVTMRTYAHEKFAGTFETLMTAPVSEAAVVLAKFTGAMVFYLVLWLPLLPCLWVLDQFTRDSVVLDAGAIAVTFLGIMLLGGVFVSLGCLASSVTRSQMVAAMMSFTGGVSFFLLAYLAQSMASEPGWVGLVFSHLGLMDHMRDFSRGVVDSRPVVFYLSLILTFLFFTYRVVDSRRWK